MRLNSNRIYNLQRHLLLHTKDLTRYKCIECGRTYASYGNFMKHVPRRHSNQNLKDIKYEQTNEGYLPRPIYSYQ